jgi:excisionase family DNA binding protein
MTISNSMFPEPTAGSQTGVKHQRPFSPETLAERWECSPQLVRQMVRRGEISGFRLGKLIRIPFNEVERVECLPHSPTTIN